MDRQSTEELVKATFWKLLGNKSFIQGAGLIERIANAANLDTLAVQGALSGLEKEGWLSGVCNGIPMGKVTPLVEKPVETPDPSYLVWKDSLAGSALSKTDQEALLPLHNIVSDMGQSDHRLLVQGLSRLRDEQFKHHDRPSFLVSAEYLLGSSKILDLLPANALRQFGIDKAQFTGAPPVLLVAGPPSPINVVLVENPHAFWNAVNSGAISATAFIVTFGYGLSRHSEEFGGQLASTIESDADIVTAVCAGKPPMVTELLNHSHIQFWGDLDVEGLRIFQRLRKSIPKLCLSALYEPMVDALKNKEKSHPYSRATAKNLQQKIKPADNDGQKELLELFMACQDRAVDQEHVTYEQIVKFAQRSLSMEN